MSALVLDGKKLASLVEIDLATRVAHIKENEGHGFRNEENRFEFYNAMEIFLNKYLKPASIWLG